MQPETLASGGLIKVTNSHFGSRFLYRCATLKESENLYEQLCSSRGGGDKEEGEGAHVRVDGKGGREELFKLSDYTLSRARAYSSVRDVGRQLFVYSTRQPTPRN